jgi:predicted Zn-dependent protease
MTPENPIFEDNVNVSKTHPLVDLLWLGGGAVLIVIAFTIILYAAMHIIAPYIPFAWEQKLAEQINFIEDTDNQMDPERLSYLQDLTNQLAYAENLESDMPITIHWIDDEMPNAFATLGGHIFVTKGLWEMMPNENALAMVIAHEIAHVKHRDPLKGLGAGVALTLVSAVVFGASDTGMPLLGSSGVVTSLHFSRSMETAADDAAIKALHRHYGHVSGATAFFESILNMPNVMPAFLQTHPLTQARIDRLNSIQTENGWQVDPEHVTALPKSLN